MKEADRLALTSPPTEASAMAKQESNANRTSRADWQSPVRLTPTQVSTQETLARGI